VNYVWNVHLFSTRVVDIPATRLKVGRSQVLRVAVIEDECCDGWNGGAIFKDCDIVSQVHALTAEGGLEALDTDNGEE